jgi:hypothetical protein
MRFILSRKVMLGIVFIVLAALGTFVVKSPVDQMAVFTLEQFIVVVLTVFGITCIAKAVQANKYKKKNGIPEFVTIVDKLWQLIDPTSGAITAIISFVLASVLAVYRLIDFNTWFGYHAILLVYFDTVNVVKK